MLPWVLKKQVRVNVFSSPPKRGKGMNGCKRTIEEIFFPPTHPPTHLPKVLPQDQPARARHLQAGLDALVRALVQRHGQEVEVDEHGPQVRRLDEAALGGVEAREDALGLGEELLRLGLLVAAWRGRGWGLVGWLGMMERRGRGVHHHHSQTTKI